MGTSRHPAFRSNVPIEDRISSTEAARIVRLHSHDPLFRRFDQLRAAGKIAPVDLCDPIPKYDRLECEYHARPWDYPLEPVDPLAPIRGVVFACTIGGLVLGIAAFNVWYWVVR